ncbi:enoyl-ACP reductase FabI [Pseudorhodoferax soli]|uniref:Enoyl-[acyl-carrier-protein] reductase [NADH] n=1 Tax=Pseudorhodoferax soli TaxID=545864 RepID=A0A368XJ88_9BURK|nr:enoyl-ACP reductase FabI [Pseudorhodoferax soli]RCW68110.1 enoyl-[acyl-carrier-protein] reductase [NADH] [Pseudorhodoferax soli]
MKELLQGKKMLVTGIANDQSIAWGCAKAFHACGAELAVTYLNDKARPHVEPLAAQLGAALLPLDVQQPGALEAVFDALRQRWGRLDAVLHSIAFAPKADLQGRLTDSSREGFLQAMDVSCHSFIRMAQLAEPLMDRGGALFTMSFLGAHQVVPHYNLMGPVKAALEAAVRYLAAELGPRGIRVHAISPGPIRTRAASGLAEFDALLEQAALRAPAHALASIDDVGYATAMLAADAARLITGTTLYVDGGYHLMDAPWPTPSR